MNWADYLEIVKSDLFRYNRKSNGAALLKSLVRIPGFRYTFLMRTTKYLKRNGVILLPLYAFSRFMLHHYEIRYGISIPYNTEIGHGFYIGHFGGIIVNYEAKIGHNCNISAGVIIGATYGGKYPGTPVIMDNVFLGPGCKIIGGVVIGNNVAIGANSVVTKDIPDNAVVVGIPGEIISYKGSSNYIVNTVE